MVFVVKSGITPKNSFTLKDLKDLVEEIQKSMLHILCVKKKKWLKAIKILEEKINKLNERKKSMLKVKLSLVVVVS